MQLTPVKLNGDDDERSGPLDTPETEPSLVVSVETTPAELSARQNETVHVTAPVMVGPVDPCVGATLHEVP